MATITIKEGRSLSAPKTPPAPVGFRATGGGAGIKESGRPDLGIVVSDRPCTLAGLFTTNAFAAPPVARGRRLVERGTARALVVNSGNANCATGEQGARDCERVAEAAGRLLSLEAADTVVSSTGIIGVPLPVAKVEAGLTEWVPQVSDAPASWEAFADAILTTDTVRKMAGAEVITPDGTTVRLLGIAKGSGMIHPNMATMLAYVFTDAAVEPTSLKRLFSDVVHATFNSLTVDGDTSTNDTALIFANGAANNPALAYGEEGFSAFATALESVSSSLARQIVRDGEGATKLAAVRVRGAKSNKDARLAARAIATSALVKTALFGEDANWGRIACALGNSGAAVDPQRTDIRVASIPLLEHGAPLPFSEEEAAKALSAEEIEIEVDLHLGLGEAQYWTCDLSYGYVLENAEYRT